MADALFVDFRFYCARLVEASNAKFTVTEGAMPCALVPVPTLKRLRSIVADPVT